MGDMGDIWRDVKEQSKQKRASNRESSTYALIAADITFEMKNDGAHLIVTHGDRVVDFWPGTGLWIERGTTNRRRGVRGLIAALKTERQSHE